MVVPKKVKMKSIILLFLISVFININNVSAYLDMVVPDNKNVFDLNLYESVLNPELCEEQISYIQQDDQELLFEFLDAGMRIPRGILTGNLIDLGNYYQCLGINQEIPDSVVEGKYCMINLPLNQTWPSLPSLPDWPADWPGIEWPDFPRPETNSRTLRLQPKVVKRLREYSLATSGIRAFYGDDSDDTRVADSPLADLTFRLAICIPKACSPHTALSSFFNSSQLSVIQFEEDFCRLPKDRPWVAGDYVSVVIFSLIGLLAVLSTAYDLRHNVFLKKDPKKPAQINKLYLAFSVYTNTRRLVTYNPVPGALECLDGIRAFAMMWVILGHTYVNQTTSGIMGNSLDVLNWITSLNAAWITAAPITVDTFFMLSGLLLVYTTAGKMTSMKLLKNLHFFYLNRLLRMFPVLAAMILLQVSLFNQVVDGPYWNMKAAHIHRCRMYWWSTLLHIQNFVNPDHMCLAHSWYLAIDVQLYILSPLVLVWVLTGKRRIAWSALIGALIAVLTASTVYNFIMKFPSGPVIPSRPQDSQYYLTRYYVHTLTRASPFFVGLIYGYILHLNRGKKVVISLLSATILWVCAIAIALLTMYSSYPIMQLDWDNQFADSMINSFMRPGWAMFVGWLVFACVHGYGGPVNWLLSLRAWKVLGRLSFAMYIVHYPLIFLTNAMSITPLYFNVLFSLFRFLADFSLAVIVAFIVTILVDSPCSILIKHFMGGGQKRPPPKAVVDEIIEEKTQNVWKL